MSTPTAPATKSPTQQALERSLAENRAMLELYERDLRTILRGGSVPNLTADGARATITGLRAAIVHQSMLAERFARVGY